MAVISIVGTSGVGKSFLIRQLSAYTSSPAFLEGEEGTIPKEILENVTNKNRPLPNWEFFINLYRNNLEKARKISDLGIDCFVDGALMSIEAIKLYEGENYLKEKEKMIKEVEHLNSDVILLVIASDELIKKNIEKRGRGSEQSKEILERALKIQVFLKKLKNNYKNVIEIDRTKMDFQREEDIKLVLDKIRKSKRL